MGRFLKSFKDFSFLSLLQTSDPRQMAVNYSCQDFGMNVTMCIYSHLLEIQSIVGEYDCDGL